MIPWTVLLMFMASSMLLALAPGPDNIFVMSQSALYGRKAGVWVTLGLCSGLLVHTAAVAFGVAAFFQSAEWAFSLLKMCGVAYLLYLAWQSFRAGAVGAMQQVHALSSRALYLRGVMMNISNPKVALFFLAFLPQFADPARGHVSLQIMLLGALFMLSALLVFGAIAWVAAGLGAYVLNKPNAQIGMNRLAGMVFVGLALHLVIGMA